MAKKDKYSQLLEQSRQITLMQSVGHLIEWDQETYLPKGAIDYRSAQLEILASYIHKQHTSKKYSKALEDLIDLKTGQVKDPSLSEQQKAALREWRRDHLKTIKLPASFVKKFAETTSKALNAWAEARKDNNFKAFAPHLDKIVKLCQKKAEYLGYQDHPYDALLDLYEPDMTTAALTNLFGKLKITLAELIKEITARPAANQDFLSGHFPHQKQMQFGHILLKAMGFDPATSRLDLTNHPFCTGLHPRDTRMTTRIHEDNPLSNIFAVIHEGGHGLYNMGHPEEHYGSPLCESISLGIEESQSRFWETIIGHSLPFWQHFYPLLQKEFPEQLGSVPLQDFYRAINVVKPSFIRIESDEATYSMHIILRFEIEKALIEGSLKVKDLPEAWNEKMRTYLGITPPNNAQGCLQDIHWAMGGMGYFPTYTLGNLYAAQFLNTFQHTFPQWKENVAKGDLSFIREWLRENIHQYGRQFTPAELVKRITGSPLSEEHYIKYLRDKFNKL